jgi:hypothetical protein
VSERVCLLHIGTHKTGTTSLQLFFEENKAVLSGCGVHVPRAGRYQNLPGHHFIAWNMLADGRSPHFDELLQELTGGDYRTVLLTSEDFSLLHARPDALQVMSDGLRSIGFRPIIAMYLRPQAVFAESMYVERIKHDYVRPLDRFIQSILTTGSYLPDGTIIHMEFQYSRLLEPFVRVFGKENVIVRPYQARAGAGHIFEDFLSILRAVDPTFANMPLTMQVRTARANESLKFLQLLYAAYAALHKGQPPSPTIGTDLIAAVRGVCAQFPDEFLVERYALFTYEETLAFLEKFALDNERIERDYGVRIPFMTRNDIAPPGDPLWARARLDREVFDRLLDRWMARSL